MLCILCLLSEKTGARNLLSQNFHLGKKEKASVKKYKESNLHF